MGSRSVLFLTLLAVSFPAGLGAQDHPGNASPAASASVAAERVVIGCVEAAADGHFVLRSVSSTDSSDTVGVTVYRLEEAPNRPLGAHAGHTVEIRGTLVTLPEGARPCCASLQGPSARSHEPEAKQPNAAAIGTTEPRRAGSARESSSPAPLVLKVIAVRPIAANCHS